MTPPGRERDESATDADSPTSEPTDESTEMGHSRTQSPGPTVSYALFECQECSTMALGVLDGEAELSCHEEPMERIDSDGIAHADPDLETLLTDVYELPPMTIDVCHFIFEEGMASVIETAERFDYDRETVSTYLDGLATAGFLDSHTLDKEDGGTVTMYRARGIETTRRAELVSLLRWAGKSALVLDEANEIKAECATRDGDLDRIFWDVYQERRTL